MIFRAFKKTDFFLRQFMPDPWVLTVALTLLVFVMASFLTDASPTSLLLYWGDGFWKLSEFTLKIVMILLGGYLIGTSASASKLLASLASVATTPVRAVLICTLVAAVASWINWGLGLVAGAMICREVYRICPKANYRLMVACSYSGFILWHGGLSGSIPLSISEVSAGNFMAAAIGRSVPVSETIFSPFNLVMVFILLGVLLFMAAGLELQSGGEYEPSPVCEEDDLPAPLPVANTPAERWERSLVLTGVVSLLGLGYLLARLQNGTFRFDFHVVPFLFLILGISLQGSPANLVRAVGNGAKRMGPVLLQFPFYAGIMGIMTSSGLVEVLSGFFVRISTQATYPLFAFYSAGLVNFFVPSGGGQWAVQGPVMIEAATKLGVDPVKVAMAISWGDAWTNLAQPFWTLPLLALAGLQIRDIMSTCLLMLFVTGAVLSVGFLFI